MARGDWVIDRVGAGIGKQQFFRDVRWLADRLPEGDFAIGLCADRYNALVAFVAVMLCGQTNLLPASRAAQALQDMAAGFRRCYCLLDRPTAEADGIARFRVELSAADAEGDSSQVEIAPDHTAAILFTSGSTGRPQASAKRWSELHQGVELTSRRFGFGRGNSQTIVATVPHYHMFGLETSLLLPLIGDVGLFRGQPFYPADVRGALNQVAASRVLVTTPVHLRACVESGLRWPGCELVLSATAPLPDSLANRAETILDAPVMEIFGSTETGAIASRRTVEGDLWHLYEGVSVRPDGQGVMVQADHLCRPMRLSDRIEPLGDRGFRLLGRNADLVKIGGKRGSLGELTHKLKQIDGVLDGAFVIQPSQQGTTDRVAALVVAPSLSKQQILAALERQIDPVFLPRPVVLADRLPLNETGKLPREDLLRVFVESAKGA